MIAKPLKGNFYDGCFNEMKQELIMSVPPEKSWYSGDGKGLIGNPTGIFNQYPDPYTSPPSYIEITFQNKYIHPTHYFLEGRRYSGNNLLKSWEFEGKTIDDKWKILHNETNKVFVQGERRVYQLFTDDIFIGFRLNMTDLDSNNAWALCPGQIELFGNIYNSIPTPNDDHMKCETHYKYYHFSLTLLIFIVLIYDHL